MDEAASSMRDSSQQQGALPLAWAIQGVVNLTPDFQNGRESGQQIF